MAKSSKCLPFDEDGFLQVSQKSLVCIVCPTVNGQKVMRRCHAADHAKSKKHLRNLAKAKGRQAQLELESVPEPVEVFESMPAQDRDELFAMDGNLEVEGNPPHFDELERKSPELHLSDRMQRNCSGTWTFHSTGHRAVPLSQLWEEFQAERTVHLDDYFEEIQRKIGSGESLFSSVLPPLEEEPQLEDDGNELFEPSVEVLFADYGIDVNAVANSAHRSLRSKVTSVVSTEEPFYPWTSMAEFSTHLLFSSPCLRFSQAQQAAVLDWAKALGAPEVPSMYAIKKGKERIMDLLGSPTEKITTASGNVFYLNAISKALAMDFANPLTRFAMQEYPEDRQGRMSQVHHGSKMLEDLPDCLAPPCVRVDHAVYFVNELLQQSTGQYFIPKKFFQARTSRGEGSMDSERTIFALGHKVSKTSVGFIVDVEKVIVPVSTFFNTFEDLQRCAGASGIKFTASSVAFSNLMPNPLRVKSRGRMVYTVPLIVFMDDVSGNISKQWNKHHVVYVSNALLPRMVLEQEFSIRFVSGSPHATPMELMQGLKESIQRATDNPIVAFDVKDQEEVVLIPYELFLSGDNPMQAEECSHGGLKCNYFCRTCKVGGMDAEKRTDEGYRGIFQCGELRTPEDTRSQIKNQIALSMLSGGTEKVRFAVSKSGVRDAATSAIVNRLLELGKALRKRTAGKSVLPEADVRAHLQDELDVLLGGHSIDDRINPLLGIPGLDIHKDTPTEILHTILLGVVKYFWAQTAFILDKNNLLGTFQIRLESINKDGLNSPTLGADYIVRFKGGLIGKHFKSLAQVMPYLVYDLVPETVLEGWLVIGRLIVLLWHTSIENTESYLANLSYVIDDFLAISAKCAPSILVTKAKFHFLLHLPMFIRRFGPAILFSTERYESFNHVFRLALIHSNRQAPSRDACQVFAAQDHVKHIVTGGFWNDPSVGRWVKAGQAVIKYMDDHPHQCRLLGFPTRESSLAEVGVTRLPTRKNVNGSPETIAAVDWKETEAACLLRRSALGGMIPPPRQGSQFYRVTFFTAVEGDKPRLQSHVILKHHSGYRIGTVKEILVPFGSRIASYITISLFELLPTLHLQLRVPCLRYPMPEEMVVVSPNDVICTVNIQHDCANSNCTSTRNVAERQEQMVTSRTKALIDHEPTNAYVVNMSSLHNYQHIEAAIPKAIRDRMYVSFVSDHTTVRLHAAGLLRLKKGNNSADPTPQDAEGLSADLEPPAFDCVKKSRAKGKGPKEKEKGKGNLKGKGKGKAPPSQDHIRVAGNPDQQSAGPSESALAPQFAISSQFANGSWAPPLSYDSYLLGSSSAGHFIPYTAAPQGVIQYGAAAADPVFVHYSEPGPSNTYPNYSPYAQ